MPTDDSRRENDRMQAELDGVYSKHYDLMNIVSDLQTRLAILETKVEPLKRFVYGIIGMALTVLLLAVLKLALPGIGGLHP